MEKPRTSHGSGLPKRIRVLFAIIFILVGILGYRTYKYFGQLEIQTNYAVLKKALVLNMIKSVNSSKINV